MSLAYRQEGLHKKGNSHIIPTKGNIYGWNQTEWGTILCTWVRDLGVNPSCQTRGRSFDMYG